ncbi:MAG: urea transporter [Bacteriovoracaceae bacterium]|nr:urea transporter [Bacteriovoracaceae bacterium]
MDFKNLRSVAQVMFQNSPLSGGLFLIGIGLASFVDRDFTILVSALFCSITANIFARLIKADPQLIKDGHYGYNALLIGIAGAVFLRPSALMIGPLLLGTALSVLMIFIITEKMPQKLNLPTLTFPFVLITWMMLFIIHRYFPELKQNLLPSPATKDLIEGSLKSFSQVFILENSLTGALILASLFFNSWQGGLYSLLAVILTFIVAYGREVDPHLLGQGLYSYNAILTAIALGSVFLKKGFEALGGTIAGIALTLVFQELLGNALAKIGLPILTAPFVLAVWAILGIRSLLK